MAADVVAARVINVDLQTFAQSAREGSVTGVIYLDFGNGPFPDRHWSDFPVCILGSWIDSLLQFEVPTRRSVSLSFMDGPGRVTLYKEFGTATEQTVDYSALRKSLLRVAEEVLSYCQQSGMVNRDWEMLKQAVLRMKADLPRLQDEQPQNLSASKAPCFSVRITTSRYR